MPRLASPSSFCCCVPSSLVRRRKRALVPRRELNMRKTITALLLAAAVSTSGCAALRGTSATPDEFQVARNAPLVIPPDYNLAPPVAGTAGTATDVQQQAIDALFGGPAPRSQ